MNQDKKYELSYEFRPSYLLFRVCEDKLHQQDKLVSKIYDLLTDFESCTIERIF
jgi:hypothetical protein